MCTDLDLSAYALSVTILDYEYTIPFANLVGQTSSSTSKVECDLFIVQIYNTEDNVIILGDPFFSEFMPVFDADQDLLGLAPNALAVSGSYVTYVGPDEEEETLEEVMAIKAQAMQDAQDAGYVD